MSDKLREYLKGGVFVQPSSIQRARRKEREGASETPMDQYLLPPDYDDWRAARQYGLRSMRKALDKRRKKA